MNWEDITFEEVKAAAEKLSGIAHRTPVQTCRTLGESTDSAIFMKCENLQRVGAFKFRGAYNALCRLSREERRHGVLTHSSGNHAQAIALAGRILDIPIRVVMPNDAPIVKRRATEEYGARVIEYDPSKSTREEVSEQIRQKTGATLIPPYDHPHIIAGQGTAALELIEESGPLDLLLVPCGGGGLLSGTAVAAKAMAPGCRVVGVEPEMADDATRSFRTGKLHTVSNPPTIADGTRTPSLGKLTFPLVLRYVDDMVTVSEEAIVEAVRFLYDRARLVVEPSGALGVAALLSNAIKPGAKTGIILSGGNIDRETMIGILSRPGSQYGEE